MAKRTRARSSLAQNQKAVWLIRLAWLVSFAAIALLIVLLIQSAFDKDGSILPKLGLLLVGIVAAIAGVIAADRENQSKQGLAALKRPRVIAIVVVAFLGAFGVLADALALFEPRPAVESTPGKIEQDVALLVKQTGAQSSGNSRALAKIPGRWGEPGCSVVYQFAIKADALLVEAVKRPEGAEPYSMVATITAARGDMIEARGESPTAVQGQAVTFTFRTNGVTERLIWDDQAGSVALELDRCD